MPGRPRTGTVKLRSDGWWESAITTDNGRRRFYAKTREEALAKAAQFQDVSGANTGRSPQHRRRVRGIVTPAVEAAYREGWSAERLVDVLVASLGIPRIKAGVGGPCRYCGSWLADTVDHAVPVSKGGSNDPDNLVSACYACNRAKFTGDAPQG